MSRIWSEIQLKVRMEVLLQPFWAASFCLQAAERDGEHGGSQNSGDDEDESDTSSNDEEDNEAEDDENEEEEEENEPLSLEWPATRRKQATYLFLLPIVFPLWMTLPDVRNLVGIYSSSSFSLWLKLSWILVHRLKWLCGRVPATSWTVLSEICSETLGFGDVKRRLNCFPGLQEILYHHVHRLHLLDRHLLLPDGVVGSSGGSVLHTCPSVFKPNMRPYCCMRSAFIDYEVLLLNYCLSKKKYPFHSFTSISTSFDWIGLIQLLWKLLDCLKS